MGGVLDGRRAFGFEVRMRLGPRSGKQFKVYSQLGAVGLELAISTVLGLLAGQWVDSKLGTQPAVTIFGLVLGVVAGFRSLIRAARKATADLSSSEHDAQDHSRKAPTSKDHHG